MEFHEIANLFPMMQPDELAELVKDIKANGLIEPILLYEEQILDGRNRWLACGEAGIKPHFNYYKGDDPVGYVISLNLHRRHLNPTQLGVVGQKLETLEQGRPSKDANLHLKITRDRAAEIVGVSPRTIASVKKVEIEAPELMPKLESGEMTANEAIKKIRQKEINTERTAIATAGASIPDNDKWSVYHGDINNWVAPRKYDFIITDPPYPREYLHLWETLALRAVDWLKPEGLLIAMSGQSYLNQIYKMLDKYLHYYWTASYLTPGQPTPLRQVNVNSTWKPLLIFANEKYTGKIFGDVFKSDGNDKSLHKWGQSESGMTSIISGICLPGQYILDPFCGAGTTGVAALRHGCLFDGLDIDEQNVNISKSRLYDAKKE